MTLLITSLEVRTSLKALITELVSLSAACRKCHARSSFQPLRQPAGLAAITPLTCPSCGYRHMVSRRAIYAALAQQERRLKLLRENGII